MNENKVEKNKKGKVFFIITCIAFAVSAIMCVIWLIVFSQALIELIFAKSNNTVADIKLSVVILLVFWLYSLVFPAISMILSGICIKFRKISIAFLAIIGVMVILHIILIAVTLNLNVTIPSKQTLAFVFSVV